VQFFPTKVGTNIQPKLGMHFLPLFKVGTNKVMTHVSKVVSGKVALE